MKETDSKKKTSSAVSKSFANEVQGNRTYETIFRMSDLFTLRNNFAKAIYILDQSPIISLVIDLKQEILWANESFRRFLGIKSTYDDILHKKLPDLLPIDFGDTAFAKGWEEAKETGFWEGQISYYDSGNEQIFQWMKLFSFHNKSGRVYQMGIILFDLSNTKMMKEEIRHLTYFDSMTNLPNSLALQDDVTNFLHYNNLDKFHLILIKITNLGKINVVHGVSYGDQIIFEAVRRIKKILHIDCKLYRFVGDTFVIFSQRFKDDYLFFHQIEKMSDMLHEPYMIAGTKINADFHFGISTYPFCGLTYLELINKGELALNDEDGKNSRIVFYTKEISEHFGRGQLLIERLKIAMAEDTLDLHYQPIIDLESGSVSMYEALLRWNDEILGYVSPVETIKQAEANNFMEELGYFIIEKVFRQGLIRQKTVSININLSQLEDPSFVANILSLVERYGIPHANIAFELVEHVNLEDSSQSLRNLASLFEYGFHIGLDDFGTGYSSFTLLNQLSIQFVKIDVSFVKGITGNVKKQNITKSIIDLAKNFRIYSICEGVETLEDYKYIKNLSTNLAQGYFFAKAVPVHLVEETEKEISRKMAEINDNIETDMIF